MLWNNLPSGSAFPAIWRASELAKSEFAGVTARIKQLGTLMYDIIIVRMRASISEGWSPTGTLVIPGRSTRVISRTFGEKIFRRICLSETPLFPPASRSVSAYSIKEDTLQVGDHCFASTYFKCKIITHFSR